MNDLNDVLQEGHYAKKQMFCNARLISWSHRRRLQIGLELARTFAGGRVLDYGCGDGTFLAMLMAAPYAPSQAVGGELYRETVEECQARLGSSKLRFLVADALEGTGPFDAVFCMEVLEHVVDVDSVLNRLEPLLAPRGKLFISVPVETGLPLVLKQMARKVAGWRGLGDYPGHSPYTMSEYCAAVLAGRRQGVVRPIAHESSGLTFPDHKGFNWMVFRELLARRFEIEKILSSPIGWLPVHLSSQVWFVLRRKKRSG